MIKNLVFDFGGVIASISRDNAVRTFTRLGVADAEHILDKYHQTGIFQELEEGKLSEAEYRQRLGGLCGRSLGYGEVQQAWLGFITGVDVEQLRYLERLRGRYRLYLLSNTNPYVMGWACSPRFTAEGKPLEEYFDGLYLSYRLGATKPDARVFECLLRDEALVPGETLFVDDGPSNIEVARRLGMHTLLAENGVSWKERLERLLGADAVTL